MSYVLLAYWEKRERQARFLGPWGPYHSAQSEKPVNESSERMGQSSLPRSPGFERLCERLWERACVGVVPPLPPVECKLQFLGVEVPDAVNLPCALSKVEGLFPLGPRGAPPIWLGGAANLLVRKPASEEASAIKSACTLRDDVVECTRRALTDCSCMAGAAMCEFGNRVRTALPLGGEEGSSYA